MTDPDFTSTQLAQFQFSNDNGTDYTSGGQEISYNGYTEIVPAVPEPASWTYALLGCAAAAGYVMKRRVRGANAGALEGI